MITNSLILQRILPTDEKYPILHMLGVPSVKGKIINVENCEKLAKAGRGKILMFKDHEAIPLTVLELLT